MYYLMLHCDWKRNNPMESANLFLTSHFDVKLSCKARSRVIKPSPHCKCCNCIMLKRYRVELCKLFLKLQEFFQLYHSTSLIKDSLT